MLPRVAVIGRTDHNYVELDALVFEATLSLLRGGAVAPRPPCVPTRGKDRQCWHNCERLVRSHGGKVVTGWSIVESDPRIPQRNRLARIALNAHAVWRSPEGTLHETCPERPSNPFIVAESLPPYIDATVEYYDRREDFGRIGWPHTNFEFRPYRYAALLLHSEGCESDAPETAPLHLAGGEADALTSFSTISMNPGSRLDTTDKKSVRAKKKAERLRKKKNR